MKFHKTFVLGIKLHVTFRLKGKILHIIDLGERRREISDLRKKFSVLLSIKNETSRTPWSYDETSEKSFVTSAISKYRFTYSFLSE